MINRRTLLSLPVLAGVAACTAQPADATSQMATTSGTVTNPTGSVKGKSLTGLVDAYSGNWSGLNGTYDGTTSPSGATLAQAQHLVLLSATTGACAREGSGGSFAANELTLRFVMVVYADLPGSLTTIPPAGDLPLTFTTGTWLTTSDGVHRRAVGTFMQAKANGAAGSDVVASSGTVTFTQMNATAYAGSYDLRFGTDHVTGSFTAPWC